MSGNNFMNLVKTFGGIFLFILMIGGLIYGIIRISSGSDRLPQIKTGLIEPYAALISNEKYDEAYNKYTSVDYKKRFTHEQYIESQKNNRIKFGILKEMSSNTDIINQITEPGRKSYLQCFIRYTGSINFSYIAVDIVEEAGSYKIDRTYERSMASDTMSEKIF